MRGLDTVRSAIRSLLAARLHLAVNLCGLTLGLASCLILIGYLAQQLAADGWIRDAESTYRLETFETHPGRAPLEIARAPGGAAEAMAADFPQIAAISRAYAAEAAIIDDTMPISQDILAVDPNFPSFMGLTALAGDATTALRDPSAIALPRSMAIKLFDGVQAAMGKTVGMVLQNRRDLTVRLVYEDPPAASHLPSRPLLNMDAWFSGSADEAFLNGWAGARFHTYLRLRPDASRPDLEVGLPDFVDRTLPSWIEEAVGLKPHEFMRFRLMPVERIRFRGAALASLKSARDPAMLWVFGGVALLILVIAVSNFLHLSILRVNARRREIALRRTLGADGRRIMTMFSVETVLVFGASALAASSITAAARPALYSFLNGISVSPLDHPSVIAGFAGLALAAALLAGSYPALLLGRIPPARMLAAGGKQGAGNGGLNGRIMSYLVGGQFLIAIALGAVTGAMLMQLRHILNADLGFDAHRLVVVRDIDKLGETDRDALIRRLRLNPAIETVTISAAVPGDATDWSEANIALYPTGETEPVQLGYRPVGRDFLATYAVRPVAGNGFAITRYRTAPAQPVPAIVNASALARLGFASPRDAIGARFSRGASGSGQAVEIVGVIPDVRFRNLRQDIRDEILLLEPSRAARTLTYRYRQDMADEALKATGRIWRDVAPDRPLNHAALSDSLKALYAEESMRMRLMGACAGLAGAIAAMGLFALSGNSALTRRREMALRKSLGATTQQIMLRMLAQTAMPVIVAAMLAGPAAYVLAQRWIEGYALRIDLTPWPFLLAGLAALVIALVTVAGHALSVARTHPAMALREE